MWLESLQQGILTARTVVWLSDGGRGFWRLFRDCFSGIVESACKWLIQQRFKGVGMRWSEDGFNHLLHLRLDWVNGRFDSSFTLAVAPNS